MSDMDSSQENANLAGLALVRQAITYSDSPVPAGDVMEVLAPYLQRAWIEQGSPEGGFNAEPALRVILAGLAQFAGVLYRAVATAHAGRRLSKAELLARLDEFEHALVAHPEESQ